VPALRIAILALFLPATAVAALLFAEPLLTPAAKAEPPIKVGLPSPGFGPATQAQASKDSMDRSAIGEALVERQPEAWLSRQVFASALMHSWSVDGDFSALEAAGRQLATAADIAIDGSGPFLSTAQWAMSVHDMATARRSLAGYESTAVKLSAGERSAAIALRGDLSFYQGDMAAAEQNYRSASLIENGPGVLVRQAVLQKARGKFDAAIRLLIDAARSSTQRTPQSMANLALQAGSIEFARGNYQIAGDWYRQAETLFPGYWKTQLYLGEAALVAGDPVTAANHFEKVAAYNSAPEAMDALAMLNRRTGDRERSLHWAEMASREWDRRVRALPTASVAHAAEHELAFGEPSHALDMARRNLALRPYGEARILLARALLANGRANDADAQLDLAIKSGWRSAILFAEQARVKQAMRDEKAAVQARERALELNPRVFSPEAALIWFAHG